MNARTPRRRAPGVPPRRAHRGAERAGRLGVIALFALALGGCLASISAGSGGISVGGRAGGVRIDVGGGGVTVGAGGRVGSVDVRIGGERGGAPAGRVPRTGESAPNGLLAKPVASGRLSSGFGPRGGRAHNGIDYAAPVGTPVFAAGDGVVEKIRGSASYGNYVRIRHSDDLASAYAHLSGFAEGLREGMRVRRGQTIGAVGATGRATGPHLHYEVIAESGFVDPLGGR